MWTIRVVRAPPPLVVKLRVAKREEPVLVQAFVPEATVETLDVRVLHGFAGLDEVEFDAPIRRPRIKGLTA